MDRDRQGWHWKRDDPLHRNSPGDRATALHRVIGLGSAKTGSLMTAGIFAVLLIALC